MMKNIIVALTLSSLIGCCGQPQQHMFVTQYENSSGEHIVYDQDYQNYELTEQGYKAITDVTVRHYPALCFIPIHDSYSLSMNFVGNYTCSVNDAFAYVTHLCDKGYTIDEYEYKPFLCTLLISNKKQSYKLYIENGTTRIYGWDQDGNPIDPEDIVYEDEP